MSDKIKLNKKKAKFIKETKEDIDEHLGCFSYPNCDLSPTGCYHTGLSYDEMDHFGYRD